MGDQHRHDRTVRGAPSGITSGFPHPLRGLLLAATAFALAAATLLAQGPRTAAAADCTVSGLSIDAQEQELINQINNYRSQNGAGRLSVSTSLHRAASWMAADMATKNYFPSNHVDSAGRNPAGRVADCGGGASGIGENIGAGTVRDSGASQFTGWRNSPGHDTNMLRSEYTHIGVARHYGAGSRYGWYWVAVFSRSASDTCSGSCGQTQAQAQTPPNGAKFYGVGGSEIWLMQNGQKRWIPNIPTLNCLPGPVVSYPLSVVNAIPTGAALSSFENCSSIPSGAKFYGPGAPEVWVMQNGQKRWIPNNATSNCWTGPVVAVDLNRVRSIPTSSQLQNLEGCSAAVNGLPPNGTKLAGIGATEVWIIRNGQKRWIPNVATLNCLPGVIEGYWNPYVQSMPTGIPLGNREGC